MMYKLSGKNIDLEMVFATEEEAKAQMKKWESDDKEDGIYSDNEYYITEIGEIISVEEAENIVVNDEVWSAKFEKWLAENGKQPEEWDYSDLGDFFRENGYTTK